MTILLLLFKAVIPRRARDKIDLCLLLPVALTELTAADIRRSSLRTLTELRSVAMSISVDGGLYFRMSLYVCIY